MGMRAAQDMGMELSRPVDVVGVGASAGKEPDVFLAPHAFVPTHAPLVAAARRGLPTFLQGLFQGRKNFFNVGGIVRIQA